MTIIDLRSDTVTQPNQAMRQAMADAEVGDDVYGDDPTVNQLQEIAAEISGKQAALFVSSGTQSNLIALLCHCGRGDEYIVGQQAHTYKYEAGGAAVLGSIQPQPLEFEADGSLCLKKVKAAIKPDDPHFAISRLLCLENTTAGKVVPQKYIMEAAVFCKENGLILHLDGARIANAAVASGESIKSLCQPFDSVSICLSKGLGAPVGSVLCGTKELIHQAKRWRKMLGGGMRQAGILAAAGIIAITKNVESLAEDHRRAKWLAAELEKIEGIVLLGKGCETNMVFANIFDKLTETLTAEIIMKKLQKENILISLGGDGNVRLVIHRGIDDEMLNQFVDEIKRLDS